MNLVRYLEAREGPPVGQDEQLRMLTAPPGCGHVPCILKKKFLDQQEFEIMDWPGNSPDLNPIENCWNHMKNKMKDVDISSLPKLKNALLKLWT
jgi:hypothetical protein